MVREPPEESSSAPLSESEIEWTPYTELHLLNALGGLKAIGVNHHFCMAVVWQRFTNAMHVNVSPETLRKHLETFYDFVNAEKLVGEVPFPNEQQDFSLPEEDFPTIKILEEKYARDERKAAAAAAAATAEAASSGKKPGSVNSKVREMILNKKSSTQTQPAMSPGKQEKKKEEKKPATPQPSPQQDKKEANKKQDTIKEIASKSLEKKLIKDKPIVKLMKTVVDEATLKKSIIKDDIPKKPVKEESQGSPQASPSGKKRSRAPDSGKKSPTPGPKRLRH